MRQITQVSGSFWTKTIVTVAVCLLLINVRESIAAELTCNASIEIVKDLKEAPDRLLELLGQRLNVSLVAELEEFSSPVELGGGSMPLQNILFAIDPLLTCKVIDGVLYIADPAVISYKANALNFTFAAFVMPGDIEQFRLTFRSRLLVEPWQKPNSNNLVSSGIGGSVFGDRAQFPLHKETLRNIGAREVLLRAASQQHIVAIFKFATPDEKLDPKVAWRKTDSQWTWHLQR